MSFTGRIHSEERTLVIDESSMLTLDQLSAPQTTPPTAPKPLLGYEHWVGCPPTEWTNNLGMRFRLIPPGRFAVVADDKGAHFAVIKMAPA